MSKLKKLKTSGEQPASLPKVSKMSPENAPPISPVVTTTEPLSTNAVDFANAVHESKQQIEAHEAEKAAKGKRGRKPLPRDAAGNIIRSDTPPSGSPGSGAAVPLNQASVAETKMLITGMLIPVMSGGLVKFALDDERAAIPEEHKEVWAQATAEELETWFPGLSQKYMRLGTVLGLPVMWFVNARNLRFENIKKLEEAEAKKKNLDSAGKIPAEQK